MAREMLKAPKAAGTGQSAGEGVLRGPSSMAWRINREIVELLGWAPAILMQLAHPLVAAGVAQHSSFRASPRASIQRLHNTVSAMLALTFGTPDEARSTAEHIRSVHDHVHGELQDRDTLFEPGADYSAHDPALLRWVHATLMDTIIRTHELYVGPLTPEEKDAYCREAAQIDSLLGIPPGYLPSSYDELRSYIDGMIASGQIAVTPTARELGRYLVAPPWHPLTWLVMPIAQLPAIGLLPAPIRRGYRFTWNRWHSLALRLTAGLIKRILPAIPPVLRHWPAARRALTRYGAKAPEGRP